MVHGQFFFTADSLANVHDYDARNFGKIIDTLRRMVDVGVGYLMLGRRTDTLSGGEVQRLKIVRHLGSSLSNITYIFDEPTAGLHPADAQRIAKLLLALRDKHNQEKRPLPFTGTEDGWTVENKPMAFMHKMRARILYIIYKYKKETFPEIDRALAMVYGDDDR